MGVELAIISEVYLINFMMKNNKFMVLGTAGSLLFAMAFMVSATKVHAAGYMQINGNTTLQVGSKGEDVRALQVLMSSSHDMYPPGSQDGSFGPMTKKAVVQFQLAYGLTSDGVVGFSTRNKMNSVISAGRGIDVSNAGISNVSVTSSGSGNNEMISFSSMEPVRAAVFYDVNPINWNNWNDEVMSLDTPNISGTANVDNDFSLNKQFTLNNLSANTRYNYMIVTTDQAGNTSAIWPSAFQTSH